MLYQRLLSSLVMIPVALAAVWFGGVAFAVLCGAVGFAVVWEWVRMVTGGRFGLSDTLAAGLVAVAALVTLVAPLTALGLVLLGAVVSLVTAHQQRNWMMTAVLYAGIPVVALVWLRQFGGLGVVVWLLLTVWATDIGAYAFGRLIGGPLLAPRISPKKTWAGLLGGMLCAGVISGIYAVYGVSSQPWYAVSIAGAVLAVVAQIGDFFESWVKRRWGAKDSSQLIPGHGGVMDRVDGLLTVAVVWAVVAVLGVL